MSTIEEAFRARLVAVSGLAENRVFNEFPEQQPPAFPVVYFIRTGTPGATRAVDTGRRLFERAQFRVGVIGESTASESALRKTLYDGLDGWRGSSLGVELMRINRTFEGSASYEDGDYVLRITEQDYEVTYRA